MRTRRSLGLVLAGLFLVTAISTEALAPHASAAPAATKSVLNAPDPAVPGPYPTVSSDYRLPGIKMRGLSHKVEMVGHVVEPTPGATTGPRPLVLFLHGRAEACYQPGAPDVRSTDWPCKAPFEEVPSHLGFTYLQTVLASQGFATVSIRANGISAQDAKRIADGGAGDRARLVEAHLDHWASVATAHQVDLSRVVLVGHSRGGEGVDLAARRILLSAPYRVIGQVLVAPVNSAASTAAYVPTVTMLGYCDGDARLDGQSYTDVSRDLAGDDTSLKSSVLVMGANHNFYNTEWTPGLSKVPSRDDGSSGRRKGPCGRHAPGRLSPAAQQGVAVAYVSAAVKLFLGDQRYLPLFDGSPVTVGSLGAADVRSHALAGGRDLRRPGIDASPTAGRGGAEARLCQGSASPRGGHPAYCGREVGRIATPHWTTQGQDQPTRHFFELTWDHGGAEGGLQFAAPLDLRKRRLELRTIVDPRTGPVDLRVRLTDSAGASTVLTPQGGERVDPLPSARKVTALWAQAVLVDASGAAGLDLAAIRSVELIGDSARGHLWVSDVAADPATLPAVPSERLPRVQVRRFRVDEGNPPRGTEQRRVEAMFPFRIHGVVRQASRFVVTIRAEGGDTVRRRTIEVAPGQTSGTIPIRYTQDRRPSYQAADVRIWPGPGLVTDRANGYLQVRDDDRP